MFEEYDFGTIEKEKLDFVREVFPKLDTRHGSLIHVATAAQSYEDSMLYLAMDFILNQTFASTANREYLIKRAADRGLAPKEATHAVGLGIFTKGDGSGYTGLPEGERFTCGDYVWVITEEQGDGRYLLTCETAGDAPNGYTGKLIPIQGISGLATALLDSIRIFGEEAEDTEVFRKRYFDSFKNVAYGFNKIEYIQVINSLDGVGAVKPFRATKVEKNGIIVPKSPGHVTVAILDSKFGIPTQELINSVQTAIDPIQNQGDGIGLAPIDHEVHIIPAVKNNISVGVNLSFKEGITFADCKSYIVETIEKYLQELNEKWENNDIIVRVVQIEARLLNLTDYIVDVNNITLNGKRENITLDKLEIVGLSEVVNNG